MIDLRNPKKLISILLTGLTIASGEYCNFLNQNYKSNSDELEDDFLDKKIVKLVNNDVNSHYLNNLYNKVLGNDVLLPNKNKYSYYDYFLSDNNNVKINILSENTIKTGVLIKNIDEDNENLVDQSLLKILDSNGNFVTYLKYEKDQMVVELKPGKYSVSQVANNISYLPNNDLVYFEVKKNIITEAKIKNKKSKTGIIIYNIDSDTKENINLLNISIINSSDTTFHYLSSIDPYRIVLAPGLYTIVVSGRSDEYGSDDKYYMFQVTDSFSKITIEHSKINIKSK